MMFALLVALTTLHVLFWQFSNFALATQVGSLLAVYILDLMSARLLAMLLNALMVRVRILNAILVSPTRLVFRLLGH